MRNIISGNGGRGVAIATLAGATLATRTNNIVVAGNYIGVDATGNVALPNEHSVQHLLLVPEQSYFKQCYQLSGWYR